MRQARQTVTHFITAVALALGFCGPALATEGKALRVGVIGNSPPMSYVDERGRLTGLNIDLAVALCETINARCELVQVPLHGVIELLADNELDFAAVSLLVTPERSKKVLFTKPYYRSLTFWLGKPGSLPESHGQVVGVVSGSAQARHAAAQGWKTFQVTTHLELAEAVSSGRATGLLVPMLTAVPLMENKTIERLGLVSATISAPGLTGNVGISVNPRLPALRDKLDAALDQLKRDGRFDRINSSYLPFKLQ